ncbi:hypothetical protein [Alginatibacterium sediminis]|uniref:hypothetical protein n=1 Tax=Alginatibacterium sediminis TaxID=2164068 RepID=UPI0011C3D401|nr:hypothetical protein [Alginatibacterium sediminis]
MKQLLRVLQLVCICSIASMQNNAVANENQDKPTLDSSSLMAMAARLEQSNAQMQTLHRDLDTINGLTQQISEQNGTQAQQHKLMLASTKINEELADLGKLIIFHSTQKNQLDRSLGSVEQSISDVLTTLTNEPSNSVSCQENLGKTNSKFQLLKPELMKFKQYDVNDDEQRALAYTTLTALIPLSMLIGEVQMNILSCAVPIPA